MVGRTISHYRIVGQLGAGGMGVVYSAEDLRLGRGVALKFVSEDLASDPSAVQRLRSEARSASSLNHPNICTIYDIDEQDGHPFIVMELMKGQTLRDRLAAGPLRIHQIVSIGMEIADALDAAHGHGIVHRDIKPGNLFLTERGSVKVLDFGLAKLTARYAEATTTGEAGRTAAGLTLGTVSYMSPEQASGEDLDGRTDLFSLGVVLYEVATGRHPFAGKTSGVVLAAILSRTPVAPATYNPDLPLRLQEVINNCLEKDRELRYQSAADLRADLKRVKRDLESGQSRPVVIGEQLGPSSSSSGAPPAASSAPLAASPPSRAAARLGWGAALLVSLVAAGAGLWHRVTSPVPIAARREGSEDRSQLRDAAVRGQLELAESSLAAGNYQAALVYANGVLAVVPDHAGAAAIREKARATLTRVDSAVAEARTHLAGGNLGAAGRSLDAARALDPTAPAVSELAAQLARATVSKQSLVFTERERAQGQRSTGPRAPGPAGPALTGGMAAALDAPGVSQSPVPPAASAPATPMLQSSAPLTPRAEGPVTPVVPAPPPAPPTGGTPAPPPVSSSPGVPGTTAPEGGRIDRTPRETTLAPVDPEEGAIRSVVAAYARAIENKDVALFKSVKPNLSSADERRLRDGFKAVTAQRVSLTVLSIDRRDDRASVVVRRRDTISVGGRDEATERGQTLTLTRSGGAWVIVDIR